MHFLVATVTHATGCTVRKRHFLRHLYIKCIILPRQARDKHRENSKKSGVSLGYALTNGGGEVALLPWSPNAPNIGSRRTSANLSAWAAAVASNIIGARGFTPAQVTHSLLH